MTSSMHVDRTMAMIAVDLHADGKPREWVSMVMEANGWGALDPVEMAQWLSDNPDGCRCERCADRNMGTALQPVTAAQFDLFS